MAKGVQVRVFVTDHAQDRIAQRGGDVDAVAAVARRAARRVIPGLAQSRRIAVDSQALPEVLSIVEVRPARNGRPAAATVKTVLPFTAAPGLEVIHV